MSPPALLPLIRDIGAYWSDEELCMCLQSMINGSPLPTNVIADVNPFHYRPSNLPDGIWYFIHSGGKNDVGSGFWKDKGETCKIFTSSFITGSRTTLEFYEGKAPHGHKTDWVMQEYSLTEKEPSENKRSKGWRSSLCRVFLSEGSYMSLGNKILSRLSVNPCFDGTAKQGSTSNSQVNSGVDDSVPLTATEMDCLSRGDFIELLDLDNQNSPESSSSENSSCLFMSSHKCFDALELQDLEPDDIQHPYCKFTVSQDNVALPPPDLVLLTSGDDDSDGNNSPPGEQIPKTHHFAPDSVIVVKPSSKNLSSEYTVETSKVEGNKNTSRRKAHGVAESSKRASSPSEEEKKAAIIRKKKLKKSNTCVFPYLPYL